MWQNNLTCYGKNLTLRRIIGVDAFKKEPDWMISNIPKHLSSLSTNCTKMDSVIDDVNSVMDAVNARDKVTDALVSNTNDELSTDELNDEENDEESD